MASDSLQQRTCCLAVRCNNNWWEVLGVSELYVKKFYHHHNWAMDIIVHSTVVQQCADLLNVKFNLSSLLMEWWPGSRRKKRLVDQSFLSPC